MSYELWIRKIFFYVTCYSINWLELLGATDYLSETELTSYHSDANELLKMIRSAILTSKSKPK